MKKSKNLLIVLFLALSLLLSACTDTLDSTSKSNTEATKEEVKKEKDTKKEVAKTETTTAPVETTTAEKPAAPETPAAPEVAATIDKNALPSYAGKAYVAINNNNPFFSAKELTNKTSFETYSNLDSLGRCGVAFANIGTDLMPTAARGSIGSVKPSGWHTVKYDCVDGKYLYNRCHLIGFQLTAENANNKNLITGTRYLNIEGMLPFENMVADYVKETKNHVLYRITPIFNDNNLLASGVLMEGYSVEDAGKGIKFCVYAYNVQPGVTINYQNGESQGPAVAAQTPAPTPAPAPAPTPTPTPATIPVSETYILNTSTKKFHKPSCGSVKTIKESNKGSYTGSREDLIKQGYSPCGNCNP